ncbi:MAG: tyrosine-type recombinase/integrase [Planctomycetota bacterium]
MFLRFKRSLGVRYESQEATLRSFDSFVVENLSGRRRADLKLAIESWLAALDCRPVTITTNHFTVLRKFCLFLRRRDPNSFVPDRDWAPRVYKSNHVPHIFSPAQILILLKQVDKMQDPFRARSYRMLILILYCTGLRIGEAVRLRIRDVDLQDKVLHVEVSKAKSRWVPFEETLAGELADYLHARLQMPQASENSRVLVQPSGSIFSRVVVSNRITALLRQCGLKPPQGRVGPRPYDTRHSFAVNRLTQWYRDGVDLQERLSWLAAYLGHDDLLGTQDYLQMTPELRGLISARHEKYIRRCWETR